MGKKCEFKKKMLLFLERNNLCNAFDISTKQLFQFLFMHAFPGSQFSGTLNHFFPKSEVIIPISLEPYFKIILYNAHS